MANRETPQVDDGSFDLLKREFVEASGIEDPPLGDVKAVPAAPVVHIGKPLGEKQFTKSGRVIIETLSKELAANAPQYRRALMEQLLDYTGARCVEFDSRKSGVPVTPENAKCPLCHHLIVEPVERKLVVLA